VGNRAAIPVARPYSISEKPWKTGAGVGFRRGDSRGLSDCENGEERFEHIAFRFFRWDLIDSPSQLSLDAIGFQDQARDHE
jgi:hypothetical protein